MLLVDKSVKVVNISSLVVFFFIKNKAGTFVFIFLLFYRYFSRPQAKINVHYISLLCRLLHLRKQTRT